MLAWLFAVALALENRPTQIVARGEEASYLGWLEPEIRTAAGYFAGKDCASATVTPVSNGPAADGGTQDPAPSSWRETFKVEGCGVADTQSVLVRREAGKWTSTRLAPGRTIADAKTQKSIESDLQQMVVFVMQAKGAGCSRDALAQSFRLVDTGAPAPPAKDKSWIEEWTVSGCEAEYRFKVGLKPGPKGVAITVQANFNLPRGR